MRNPAPVDSVVDEERSRCYYSIDKTVRDETVSVSFPLVSKPVGSSSKH